MKKPFILFFSLVLLASCENNTKIDKHIVVIKSTAYGFGESIKSAQINSDIAMGGFLVGVNYQLTNNSVKLTTAPFDSGLKSVSDITKIKKGRLKNQLYFYEFPVNTKVNRPVINSPSYKGEFPLKKNGSFYYPIINKVLTEKYKSFHSRKKGKIFFNSLKYIENPKQEKNAPWGIIQYDLNIVEEGIE